MGMTKAMFSILSLSVACTQHITDL